MMWHHDYHAGHYGYSAGSWLGHTIVSAIIHGLIYGAIFHIMRGMGIGEVLLVAGGGVALVGCGWWIWNRLAQGGRP